MSKPYFVKFETPKEIAEAGYEALRQARQTGKIRKGTNETTKAIERNLAKLVIIAEDIDPPEVVAHLPILCDERSIPYVYVPTRSQMGPALGIDLGAAAACIVEPGESEGLITQIVDAIKKIRTG
jgi:large subunit ribosomal protein L7Ae